MVPAQGKPQQTAVAQLCSGVSLEKLAKRY